jgi:aconitase B
MSERDPIEYLLNAMISAGYQDNPAQHGYAAKRRAVLDAIASLRADRDAAYQAGIAAERERCARVCDSIAESESDCYIIAEACAAVIRSGE